MKVQKPAPKNPEYKQMTITAGNGQKFTASAGSLVKNLLIISDAILKSGVGVVAYTPVWWRGDLEEFTGEYINKRTTSQQRIKTFATERNLGLWIEDFPNIYLSASEFINGGHCVHGALESTGETFRIAVLLGVDARMKPKIDWLKLRTTVQQGKYVEGLYHKGVADGDLSTLIATTKLIVRYLHDHSDFVPEFPASVVADKLIHLEQGRKLLRASQSGFIELSTALLAADPETHCFKQAFFAPLMMLWLTGSLEYRKWAKAMASGADIASDDTLLLRCQRTLITDCRPSQPGYRDVRAIKDIVQKAICMLYAKATGTPYVAPLAMKKLLKNGMWANNKYSARELERNSNHLASTTKFFTDKIVTHLR